MSEAKEMTTRYRAPRNGPSLKGNEAPSLPEAGGRPIRRVRHLGVGEVRFWSPWVLMIRRHEKGSSPSSQGAADA
jgi:hypothetical protein